MRIMGSRSRDLRRNKDRIIKIVKFDSIFKKFLKWKTFLRNWKVWMSKKVIFSCCWRLIFLLIFLNIFNPCWSFTEFHIALIGFCYKSTLWFVPFLCRIFLKIFIWTGSIFECLNRFFQIKLLFKLKFLLRF